MHTPIYKLEIESYKLKELLNKEVEYFDSIDSIFTNVSFNEAKSYISTKILRNYYRYSYFLILEFSREVFVIIKPGKNFEIKVNKNFAREGELVLKFSPNTYASFSSKPDDIKVELVRKTLNDSKLLKETGIDITRINIHKFLEYAKQHQSIRIGGFLLTSKLFSGLTDTDVSEILYISKLRPDTTVAQISTQTLEKLYSHIIEYLKETLNNNHKEFFTIYGNTLICRKCGSDLSKRRIMGVDILCCLKCQR